MYIFTLQQFFYILFGVLENQLRSLSLVDEKLRIEDEKYLEVLLKKLLDDFFHQNLYIKRYKEPLGVALKTTCVSFSPSI